MNVYHFEKATPKELNLAALNMVLNTNLETDRCKLKTSLIHSPGDDVPLDYKMIIESCFANKKRKAYPNFLSSHLKISNISLCHEKESAFYWMNLVSPKSVNKFN
jgi:hypothetical protein